MKIKFYSLFLFFSSFCFSQTYQFDILTKYTSKNSSSKITTDFVNYFNTADFSYTLSLAKSNHRFVALLWDRTKNLTHSFTVLETKEKGEIKFQFKYDYSFKNYITKNLKDYYYEFSEPSESSQKEVTLKIFKNKKSKKPDTEQKLTLQNTDQNLFPVYQNTLLAHYPSNQDFPANSIVSKAIEVCNKCTCEINLTESKKVSVEIKLPKNFKFSGNL